MSEVSSPETPVPAVPAAIFDPAVPAPGSAASSAASSVSAVPAPASDPAAAPDDPAGPRPTLAARLAERSRQRALRAERLARLRPPASVAAGPAAASSDEAETALQEFLRALTGDLPAAAPAQAAAEPAEVLSFQRPERPAGIPEASAVAVSDLERLPGVGPNLVWALEQAGIGCLADLAPLTPEDLVARLGPIGRLVPAAGWIAAARASLPAN